MTALLDSSVWIEYWKGGGYADAAAQYIEGHERALPSTINVAEVHYWIAGTYGEEEANERVASIERRCHLLPVSKEIAIDGSRLKQKYGLSIADCLILSTAHRYSATLITGDSGFEKIDNVVMLK